MKTYEDLSFRKLVEHDIEQLTIIMKKSFDEDTRIHLGEEQGGPTGYDDGSFLRKYGLDKEATAYTILLNEKIIGAIILYINSMTNENYLGNVFVDVDLESKGIGIKIWQFVEKEYPKTKIWRTDTPIYSRRNHHFYVNKCGFHVVKINNPKDIYNGSFVLEKVMP